READQQTSAPLIHVTRPDGRKEPLNAARLRAVIDEACLGLGDGVSPAVIYNATMSGLYDGISEDDVFRAAILAARALIEREPNYSYATARLLLDQIRHEVLGESVVSSCMTSKYPEYFGTYIQKGVSAGRIDPRLAQFDLERIGAALKADRDLEF